MTSRGPPNRGPNATPDRKALGAAQLADMENNASPEALLDMGPETLIACQGEETKDLEVPRAKETEGEFPALRAFVARSGPPDLVTLTIGRNDLGFANILTACFLGGAEICHRQAYQLGNKLTTGASSLIAMLDTATYLAMKASAGEGSQLGWWAIRTSKSRAES